MRVHECVSFLLVDADKVLLEKRTTSKEHDPGLIAIPGGHMEPGESQTETLVRELKEELDVVPASYHYLCSLYHPTTELQLIHYYVITRWQGRIAAYEAESVFWTPLVNAAPQVCSDRTALTEWQRLSHSTPQLFTDNQGV